MIIKLYNTQDSNNTINKTLTEEIEYDITFKDVADTLTPIVRLQESQLIQRNYAYIPEFDRYYFVRNISTLPNHITTLELEVDVLESYKDDILQSQGIITRHEGANKYYDGGDWLSEERKTHKIFESDTTPEFEEHIILVTIGG